MPKPLNADGRKNLLGENLKMLRTQYGLSQRELSARLQLMGLDIDKNAIMRIEAGKRYVSDIELCAFARLFGVSVTELLQKEKNVN